jgi:hypothetical protein
MLARHLVAIFIDNFQKATTPFKIWQEFFDKKQSSKNMIPKNLKAGAGVFAFENWGHSRWRKNRMRMR